MDMSALVVCECMCVFFLTHHEMRLGQYPSEFFSFVVLWVAGDLFQYLTQREKIQEFGLSYSLPSLRPNPKRLTDTFTPRHPTCCTSDSVWRVTQQPHRPSQSFPDTASHIIITANLRPTLDTTQPVKESGQGFAPPPPPALFWRDLV